MYHTQIHVYNMCSIPPEQVHGNADGEKKGTPVHQDTLFMVEEVMERERKRARERKQAKEQT